MRTLGPRLGQHCCHGDSGGYATCVARHVVLGTASVAPEKQHGAILREEAGRCAAFAQQLAGARGVRLRRNLDCLVESPKRIVSQQRSTVFFAVRTTNERGTVISLTLIL